MMKKTVLIVDDEEVNRALLGKILQEEYDLLFAEDGQEALDILREKADIISAVLLDIIMPEVDGFQVLREMSEDPVLSLIPVIVSSFMEGDESEIYALSLGAQDFIVKPFKPDIIHHRLSNLIRLRESAVTINKTQKDPLTGLYNKEFFINKVESILRSNPDKHYDILHFGIERFKLVNDAYGIKKGDEVLQYLANIFTEACGKDNVCGRFGGDKFFTLGEHIDYTNDIFAPWIEKIKECPIDMDIKIHCGIYEIKDIFMEVQTMCDRAELAANRNRGKYDEYYTIYDDSLRSKILEEQFILGSMHTALEERQFQVYYQPKYDLNTETIAGAEALVRWIHPEKGFLSPGDFIPIFERNGFITQLDYYVWEETCKNIRHWIDMGYSSLAVSVNVSRADIYNPKLLDILQELVARYDIPISNLHLEITESAYTDNPHQIISAIQKLKDAGFIIEMDDFGSGYSSLNMLAEMPIDVIKLDMRFVQTEAKLSSGKGIIGFIISLAKWLGLTVVAEGVETSEEVAMLQSMDCNYVQGYYYAKPMKLEDFEEKITTSKVIEMITARNLKDKEPERKPIRGLNEGKIMLIVDDIEINRAVLASAFTDKYVIEEKENGLTAWAYLDKHYQDVEIIMLDLLMPEMDGFQLIKKVRGDERMKDMPIIITSQGGGDSERKSIEMQANDYIMKPYNLDIIRHRVKNVIGCYQLECLKKDLISKEDLQEKNLGERNDSKTVDEEILDKMKGLKAHFDIVRLVDPTKTEPVAGDLLEVHKCFSVWGKSDRCDNCISLKAYKDRTRYTKLETKEDGSQYFVTAEYVPFGKKGAVLELVTKLD